MTKARACKDCPPSQRPRPAPYPGPRCATHHRAAVRQRKDAAHERHVQKTFGLGPGDYELLYQFQNGRCWICQRATGAIKKLATDHDHRCTMGHDPKQACRACLRGLLCGPCNRDVLGHLRDSPEALLRAYYYLLDPPARRVLPNVTDVTIR